MNFFKFILETLAISINNRKTSQKEEDEEGK